MLGKETIQEYFVSNYNLLLKLAVILVGDKNIAQDILHDVMVVLLSKQDELADVKNYPGYIAVCVRRTAINYYRKSSRLDLQDPDVMAEIFEHPEAYLHYDYIEWVVSLQKSLSIYLSTRISAGIHRALRKQYSRTRNCKRSGYYQKCSDVTF